VRFLLPFKGLESAKSRWPALGRKREDLVLGLLQRNLKTVVDVVGSNSTFLVSPDPEIAGLFSKSQVVYTEGRGLNEDLREAARQVHVQGEPLVVLLPDLPGLSGKDVKNLVDLAHKHQVVICPDQMDVGTNALSLNPYPCLDFLFEGSSFQRHLAATQRANLSHFILRRSGLAQDCDDIAALERFSLI
jgi:2-phospho-L-lactate/phosphoenolpyruvate guanylyltransferase